MRVRVLGSLVVDGDEGLPMRDRAVLAVLVVRAGSHVSMSELADAIWGDQRPATYRKVVQGSVVRLRRKLGEDAISSREGGYAFGLPLHDIDAVRFENMVESAEVAIRDGDPQGAAAAAGDAIRLWRGLPYPELAEWPPAQAAARRYSELRETAEDVLVEATLLSGRADAAVARAEALATAAPYRERRWALLARAQYAAGRQAEALATLRTLRSTLAEELGIDWSRDAADLETAMLRHDPSLGLPSAVRSGRWLFSRAGRIVAASLAAATVLVVGLAVAQHQRADDASREAVEAQNAIDAVRLGELAAAQRSPSIALALAAEALSLDASDAVRVRVMNTFGNFSDLLSIGDPPVQEWPEESSTAISPDGHTTATAHAAAIQLATNDVPTSRLPTPTDNPSALVFSPDGRYLAAGMSELGFPGTGSTIVWDVASGTEVAVFDSGEGAVRSHVFAPDSSSVWSYGDDGVHHWDLTGSNALARTADGGPVAFRAGDLLFTMSDPTVEAWIEYACGLAGRPLTAVEWREYVGDRPYSTTCR